MKKKFLYNTIFTYGSLQSVGHTVDYFIPNTKKLVVFIVMPRINGVSNRLKIYDKGVLSGELVVPSSQNIILYYALWWYYHNAFLLRYFSRSERVLVLASHPIAFMGMSIMGLLRKTTYAYWIGDYFPPVHWSLVLFEKVKKRYHDRIAITYYLSDRINKLMNGKIVRLPHKRTVMWGMQPSTKKSKRADRAFRLLFVGAIRPSQGVEGLLEFLRSAPDVYVSIVGVCEKNLYVKYMRLISRYGLSSRAWFPNRFIKEHELMRISQKHQVGIALYEKGKDTATYYTDPGKIKTYIEMGLPVVMTNTSAIVPYIKKYKAGVVIDDKGELSEALLKIKKHYSTYKRGVAKMSQFFCYDTYYNKSFTCLEDI